MMMYIFEPSKLGKAHEWCRIRAELAMELGLEVVVIDNTNTQRWEYQDYLDLAEEYGYQVEIVAVGSRDESALIHYAQRNVHGVPLSVLKKQASRFEE